MLITMCHSRRSYYAHVMANANHMLFDGNQVGPSGTLTNTEDRLLSGTTNVCRAAFCSLGNWMQMQWSMYWLPAHVDLPCLALWGDGISRAMWTSLCCQSITSSNKKVSD